MSNTNTQPMQQLVAPISDTAASPTISWGGSTHNRSGTGLYGTYTNVKTAIGGTDILTVDATGITSSAGITATTVTGAIVGTTGLFSSTLGAAGTLSLNTTNKVIFLNAAGAPTNGVTGANTAGIGSLYVDITAGKLYINTGTLVSPTWTVVGSQS